MLHSLKHTAPASVRRPSQDGYRPRNSETRASEDFRRATYQRQSLDVRRPSRHSSSDLYPPRQRRASEPGRHPQSGPVRLTASVGQNNAPLESPKEERTTEINEAPLYTLSPTTSPTAIETTQGLDGSESPTTQASIDKREINERPPPLPYCLWDHKLAISVFWFLILAESFFVPIALYYGLIYGTNLREGARKSSSRFLPCPNSAHKVKPIMYESSNPPLIQSSQL